MKETIKNNYLELKTGIKTMFKEFFNKNTNKKQRANMWTFSRAIISIPILILSVISLISFSAPLLIANSVLVGLGAITDYFDGKSARKHGSTSEFGKKLDQLVDKIFSIIIGVTLALINPIYIVLLLGEAFIAAVNIPIAIKYKNADDTSSFIGKIKQWPLSASFLFGYISQLTPGLNAISSVLVFTTFMLQLTTASNYIKRNYNSIKRIKEFEKNKLLEIDDDTNKTNDIVKNTAQKNIDIENKQNNENIQLSRIELCETLKKIKQKLINDSLDTSIINTDDFQKNKKL